jgi:hypothetical protein
MPIPIPVRIPVYYGLAEWPERSMKDKSIGRNTVVIGINDLRGLSLNSTQTTAEGNYLDNHYE